MLSARLQGARDLQFADSRRPPPAATRPPPLPTALSSSIAHLPFAHPPLLATPSFLPESLLNRIREELACVVCMDLAVRPSTLPCGHTACRKCLNAALSCQGGPAKQHHCPTCRTLLPVGMPALALNTTLKNLAELLLPGGCCCLRFPLPP